MPKSLTSTQEDAINSSLLAFKPREVLLANRDMKHNKPSSSADGAQTLSPDQKSQLLRAVARFLKSNGFSRTLKKFFSEAGIENHADGNHWHDIQWEKSRCCLADCHNASNTFVVGAQMSTTRIKVKADKLSHEAKKSKIAFGSLADVAEEHQSHQFPGATGKKKSKMLCLLKENVVGDSEAEKKPKDKKKKKTKSSMDSVSAGVEQHGLEEKNDANEICKSIADDNPMDEKSVKSKSKEKKDGLVSEGLDGENGKALSIGDMNGTCSGKDDFKISEVDATDKENKCSKKRKRLVFEGNDSQPTDNKEDEESKRKMVEGSKASKGSEQPVNNDASQGKAENSSELEKRAEKSLKKKSKKQLNGSAEGFSARKDQKRSEGHTEEAIDQQSHSVKFNYSDED